MKFIKENIRLVIAVIIAIILIAAGAILLIFTEDDKEKPTKPKEPVQEENREEQLIDATGMTKEDAIKIVKANFGSDNYEFTAEATKDGLYKVTVKNTVEDSKFIYYVDPTNGEAYLDLEA